MENQTLMIKITMKGKANDKKVSEVITEIPCLMENILDLDWFVLSRRYMINKNDESVIEALHDYLENYVEAFIAYIKDVNPEDRVIYSGLWVELMEKYNLEYIFKNNETDINNITDTIINVGPLLFEIDCELVTLSLFSAANINDDDNIAVSGSAVKKLINNINKELNSLFGEENEEEL